MAPFAEACAVVGELASKAFHISTRHRWDHNGHRCGVIRGECIEHGKLFNPLLSGQFRVLSPDDSGTCVPCQEKISPIVRTTTSRTIIAQLEAPGSRV